MPPLLDNAMVFLQLYNHVSITLYSKHLTSAGTLLRPLILVGGEKHKVLLMES